MNKRGELKITSMMLSLLFAFGLFIGFIGWSVLSVENIEGYDISTYNVDELNELSQEQSISAIVEENKASIENANVDFNVFDWVAGIWNKLASPFRNIYSTFNNLINVFVQISSLTNLPSVFVTFFSTAIVIIIIISIVMIKFKLGKFE